MKNLPIGIQTFAKIRDKKDNFVYVDKTEHVYNLVSHKGVIFLSRPRRFGKSVIVSTIEAVFQGKKELFEGLWLYDKWDWSQPPTPVIRIDWTKISHRDTDEMEESLCFFLDDCAKEYGVSLNKKTATDKFEELIVALNAVEDNKIAILIDEYDKPLTDNLFEPQFEKIRQAVHDFYQVMKGADAHIRFIFITGVSKFSGLSVFSALNNPDDITMNDRYATICGYTQQELETYFPEHIRIVADKFHCTHQEMLDAIRFWYNGYSWDDGSTKVYNPFSTMKFFSERNFKEFWFKTGSPSFLIKLLEERGQMNTLLEEFETSDSIIDGYDPKLLDEIPLFFQTGYLTVKTMVSTLSGVKYTLGIPNYEVRQALMTRLLFIYGRYKEMKISALRDMFEQAVLNGDEEALAVALETIIARAAPNELKMNREAHYHSLLLVWLNLIGFECYPEISNNLGRTDAVWKHNGTTVVAELKYSNEEAADNLVIKAMAQIHERRYYNRYLGKVILLAVAFSGSDIRSKIEIIER
jgi:hypothetical protein